jgi:hypothetical protein
MFPVLLGFSFSEKILIFNDLTICRIFGCLYLSEKLGHFPQLYEAMVSFSPFREKQFWI